VAACYQGVVDALVLDESDAGGAAGVGLNGVRAVVTKTLMQDSDAAAALARVVLDSA
jgi:hypothetical protein